MTATLTNGRRIRYDRVVLHESPRVSLYQFSRAPLGVVAVVPKQNVKELAAQ